MPLLKFETKEESDQILVLFSGHESYYQMVAEAFPSCRLRTLFHDKLQRYDWGFYIHNIDTDTRYQVEMLLDLFRNHIAIDDTLDETHALGYHTDGLRAKFGELVYQAKPYSRKPTPKHYKHAGELAEEMITFCQRHPRYRQADIVLPVPPSPGKDYDLPTLLAARIAERMHIRNGVQAIYTKHLTNIKDASTRQEKEAILKDAFAIRDPEQVRDHVILVVDDIYQSGATLNQVAHVLRQAGAQKVIGLTATKTRS